MRARVALAALLFALSVCGALADPFLPDEVAFSTIERTEFDAIAVRTVRGDPSAEPLVVRVRLVGDAAATADLSVPMAWLRDRANVVLVPDARGVPLYLTGLDLAATSGRGTLGATVPSGMAAEVSKAGVGDCVVAHEVLHFVGLRHVADRQNIMYQHCSEDFLERAMLDDAQLDRIATVDTIRATTPVGVVTWATR